MKKIIQWYKSLFSEETELREELKATEAKLRIALVKLEITRNSNDHNIARIAVLQEQLQVQKEINEAYLLTPISNEALS